jgi:hypothetical protein
MHSHESCFVSIYRARMELRKRFPVNEVISELKHPRKCIYNWFGSYHHSDVGKNESFAI